MSGTAYSQVPQIERDALIALYNSTDGANWKDNTGWMGAAGTECTWFGVTCSNNSVSSLSFWQNQLTGTIPSELGNLTNLTYLHFGANSLSGSIPKELGNLTKLTGIYLYSNALTGAIPQEWSDITNVNYDGNLFTGPGFTISATERDALIALYNSTGGANWKDNTGWMGEIGTECDWKGVYCSSDLKNLNMLYLNNNSLTGSIPAQLGNLTKLTYLYLDNNSLTGSIPAQLGNLTKLTTLVLNNNSLTGSIPAQLGNLTKLTTLYLSYNSLSGSIPKELGSLTNLVLLYLNNNSLSGTIPSEVSDLPKLTNVNYDGNLFAEPGCTISATERDALNAALPDSFDYVICYGGTSYTASFSFVSNRGPNFEVWKQKDDGTFDVLEVPIIRTYIGIVQGVPGATISAVRFDSGNVFYRAVFEDGREWINTGGQTDLLCDKGANNICKVPELKFPEFAVGEGGAGSLIYGVEVGVDMPFHQFDGVHANDIVAALSIIEYSVNTTNALYMREAGIKHELGKVIIRASRAQDPYHTDQLKPASCAGSCVIDDTHFSRKDEIENQWENILPGEKTHNMALVINTDYMMNGGAGLAQVARVGNPRGYSSNDTTEGVGDFSRVWRHEVGHLWGNGHYTGNAPEGGTIMSNNNLGRFSGPEQKVVLDIKAKNLESFTNLGSLQQRIAPNASLDSILAAVGNDTLIDVLGNDHDANGDEITLVGVDKISYLGANVQIAEGKGAEGRDAIMYSSGKLSRTNNVDRLKYRIRDSSGLESVGYAYIKVGEVAGTFKQDFNDQADGRPLFTDGSTATGTVYVNDFKPSISNGALQLTPDKTWSSSSYTVPKLNLENGFTAKFKVKISSSTSPSADGFAVNFGEPIPTQAFSGNNFGGYARGLTIEFNTYTKKGYRVFVNDEEIPNSFVANSSLVDDKWRDVAVEWLAPGSLKLFINGESVISNLNTSSFIPTSQDQISFSAQTRSYAHEVLLDDVEVSNLFGPDTKTTYGGGEYEIVGTPMTWSEAAAYAKSKGATLVRIKSVEQNTWIKNLLKNINTIAADGGGAVYSWLGGTDSVTEGSWLWEDGTQVPLNSSVTNWWGNGPGHGSGGSEPDNFGSTQHCLAMGLSGWPMASPGFYGIAGQWNDVNCSNKLRFAIQYPQNASPQVSILGGSRSISDTDAKAGESVSVTASATDSDGTIATTQWLVDGVEVGTGLSASVSLPNGSTVVTFKATDDDGASSTTTATITIEAPAYTPTEEWPAPYSGVTPDTSLGLAFNNIGIFNSSDATIYACLRLFTNGLASSSNGISQFDIGLKVVSLSDLTVQITKSREFNTIGALNEKVQAPDCSGIFETTTGLYTDIIQANSSVLETVWSLIDSTKLILKLVSSKELTAN